MFLRRSRPVIARNTFRCANDWNAMDGDGLVRRCATCQASVYDLTGLDEQEVIQFIRLHDGEVCAAVEADRDGRVINGACAAKTYTTLGAVRVEGGGRVQDPGVVLDGKITLATRRLRALERLRDLQRGGPASGAGPA